MNRGGCPEWCTRHDAAEVLDDDGRPIESHRRVLFHKTTPGASDRILLHLDVSQTLPFTSGGELCPDHGAGLSVWTSLDGPPWTLDPMEARQLAAALLRGAEIVEATLTALCPSCGRAVTEEEAIEPCFRCEWDARVKRRAARRSALKVVDGGGSR